MDNFFSTLVCTSNTHSHVDYGIPIVANKSTDYRTSTGTYHRFIPSVSGDNDCRVQTEIKPELKTVDITILDDRKSVYNNTFVPLPLETDPIKVYHERAQGLKKVDYIRNVREMIVKNPPPPTAPKLSEMKDAYRTNYYRLRYREVVAPASDAKCEIEGFMRPLQPGIPPEEIGFYKHLDIYMTDNRLRYPPYTKKQMEQAREDLPTFYSATQKYKQLKVPLPSSTGNTSMYDKTIFKHQLPLRCLSRAQKNVPNMQFKTEYNSSYKTQTYSDLYPYINTTGVDFEKSLSEAGPWLNLSPPGMYCTEYCHTGTGWPIRALVDIGLKKQPLPPHDTISKIQS